MLEHKQKQSIEDKKNPEIQIIKCKRKREEKKTKFQKRLKMRWRLERFILNVNPMNI